MYTSEAVSNFFNQDCHQRSRREYKELKNGREEESGEGKRNCVSTKGGDSEKTLLPTLC